jgi:PAS domain S-box-containing protein
MRVSGAAKLLWFTTIQVAVVPVIGWSDYLCGPQISLSLFYLVPIAATAWWFGRSAGLLTAAESALVAFAADYVWTGSEGLPIELWNTVTRVIIFFFAAAVVARLRADSDAGRDELRVTQEELARSHEQLWLLVDGIRERSVMMLDADGRILLANEGSRRLRGYTAAELTDKPFWSLAAAPADSEAPRRWLAEAAENGSCEFESWELRKDGSRFCSAGVLSSVRDAEGRLRGYSMVSQDVTRQREAEATVRALTARLIGAQEEERRHLARELHDEVGAALTCVRMAIEAASHRSGRTEPLQAALDAVGQALDQVRQISVDLRPSVLDDLGIVPALRWYLDKRPRAAGLQTQFESQLPAERLDPALEITCFRIAQEAVTNVLRHAEARSLRVSLERVPPADGTEPEGPSRGSARLVLRLQDDGKGFRPPNSGLGLSTMSERAALIGGTVHVRSQPGEGTEVVAELPLRPRAREGHAS